MRSYMRLRWVAGHMHAPHAQLPTCALGLLPSLARACRTPQATQPAAARPSLSWTPRHPVLILPALPTREYSAMRCPPRRVAAPSRRPPLLLCDAAAVSAAQCTCSAACTGAPGSRKGLCALCKIILGKNYITRALQLSTAAELRARAPCFQPLPLHLLAGYFKCH